MRTNISPVAKSVTWVSLGQGSRITSESGEYGLALKSIRSEEPVKEISEDAMAQEIAEFEKMLAARGISQSIYSGGLRRYSGNKFSFTTQSPYFARHSPKGDISSQANKYSYSSRIDKEAGRFEENIHHGHNETSEVTKNDRDVDTSPGQLIGMLSGVQLNPQAEEFIPKTMEDLQIKTILSASLLNTQLHQKTQSSPGSAAKDELANVTSVHAAQDQVQQPVDPTVTNYSGCVFIMQACTSKFPVVEGVYSTLDAAITAAKQCIDRFGEPTVKKFSGDRYNLLAGRGPVARARVFPQELLGTTKAAEIKKVYVSLDIGEEGAITVISAHDTVSIFSNSRLRIWLTSCIEGGCLGGLRQTMEKGGCWEIG